MATIKLRLDGDGNVRTGNPAGDDLQDHNIDQLTWFDLHRSETDSLKRLVAQVGAHPLALEDAIEGKQRPKIDVYDEHLFIVFYAIHTTGEAVQNTEVSIFFGPHYVITVRDGDCEPLEDVAKRWNALRQKHDPEPGGILLFSMLDAMVDAYFPVIDDLGERIEELESTILDGHLHNSKAEIFNIRQNILKLRRIVAPERDVLNHLMRQDTPMFPVQTSVRFSDVYDHLMRALDWLETYRDQMATLLDLQTATSANNLNKTMQTLTVSSIILMTASLVAGIYGMNFDHMPELHWELGYPLSLLVMLALALILIVIFKRKRWL